MLDRVDMNVVEDSSSDNNFHRWLAERNRRRAARLGWALLALLIATVAVVGFLVLQLNQTAERFDAAREDIRRLNRRVNAVVSEHRADSRRAEQTEKCLESQIDELSEGLRRLFRRDITTPTYLRRYGDRHRCR